MNNFYSKYKIIEPFDVVTTHAISTHNTVVKTPLFNIFNENDLVHKFYIYDISNGYDGLLGIDLLKKLNVTMDLDKEILKTMKTEIPIQFSNTKSVKVPLLTLTIQPRTK